MLAVLVGLGVLVALWYSIAFFTSRGFWLPAEGAGRWKDVIDRHDLALTLRTSTRWGSDDTSTSIGSRGLPGRGAHWKRNCPKSCPATPLPSVIPSTWNGWSLGRTDCCRHCRATASNRPPLATG